MASPSFSPKHSDPRCISLADIDSVVAARIGPTRGLGKSQPACFNRQVAMYLASHVGRCSTTVIGRFYGGRDHSTVVHAIQRIEAMCEADPNLDVLVCDLKSRLGATAESMVPSPPTRLLISSPEPQQIELRLVAEEITAQIRKVFREELRYAQHREQSDASEQ